MTRPRQTGACVARDRNRGALAVELALGLLVLLLAGWLAFAGLNRVQHRHRCDQLIADLGDFSEIFRTEARRLGPKNVLPASDAALPATIEQALDSTHWRDGSPFGGSYEWAPSAAASWRPAGAILVTAFAPSFPLTLTPADLLYIDRVLDDGDLTTGRFRTGFNGWPVYALQP